MTRPSRSVVTGLLALGLVLSSLGGCGYAHRPTFPQGIRTVAVPIFDNRSFFRGAERDVTEALIKQIERETPYKVVAPMGADTELSGSIVAINSGVLSRDTEGGVPQEEELRYVINFEWKNLRTGKVIRERKGFQAVGRYVPVHPVGEDIRSAELQAADAAAQAIVSVMRSDW